MKITHLFVCLILSLVRIRAQDIDPDELFDFDNDFDLTPPNFEYTTLDPNSFFPTIPSNVMTTTEKQFEEWPFETTIGSEVESVDPEESSREYTTKRIEDTIVKNEENVTLINSTTEKEVLASTTIKEDGSTTTDSSNETPRNDVSTETAISKDTTTSNLFAVDIITHPTKSVDETATTSTTTTTTARTTTTERAPITTEKPADEEDITEECSASEDCIPTNPTLPPDQVRNDSGELTTAAIETISQTEPSYTFDPKLVKPINVPDYPRIATTESQSPNFEPEEPEFVFDPSLKKPIEEDPVDSVVVLKKPSLFGRPDCDRHRNNQAPPQDPEYIDNETSNNGFKFSINTFKSTFNPISIPSIFGNAFNGWQPRTSTSHTVEQQPSIKVYRYFSTNNGISPTITRVTQDQVPVNVDVTPFDGTRRILISTSQIGNQRSYPTGVQSHSVGMNNNDFDDDDSEPARAYPVIRNCYHKVKDGPPYMQGDTNYGQVFDGRIFQRCFYCCKYSANELCYQTNISSCGLQQTQAQTQSKCKVVKSWSGGIYNLPTFKVDCS